ncbi:glucosaminidase domain-containing protein [Listeria sp. PSOL-1]|uniref:glucosaminidase domain-containing protein n=1 Tax=Listeria sp. PSOL-1 TaxID=1844999 RepID=UPI00351ABE88
MTAPEPAYKTKQQAFINKLSKHAQEIQQKTNILTSITLAQAILESNWGESELSRTANNLFGVKGKENLPTINLKTKEYTDGKWIEIKANFRKYRDWNESLDEHANLFVNGTSWNKTKYHPVIQATDYKLAAKALQSAGYATDPDYALKLVDIVERYQLSIYDKISDQLLSTKKISEYAKVNKDADATVWSVPYGLVGAQKVEKITFYRRDKLQLVREAKTSNGLWYQFAVDDKVVGWVKSGQITKK